ncbi:MAG: hypothetical protein U0R78_16460 [Nocardioidaceae bacterium]
MKRLLAAATSAIALVAATLGAGLASSPAAAVDPSTPVYDGLPDGWSFDWLAHASPEFGSFGNYQHVAGAPTGWGTGSLLLQMGPVSEVNLKVTRSLAGLTAASAWVRVSNVAVEPESLGFFVNVQGTTYSAPLPISLSWTQVDLGNLQLTEYGNPSNEATLLGLAVSNPTTATLIFNAYNGFDAGGAQAFVDGVSFTADGAVGAVDFEDAHTPVVCDLGPAMTTIVAGHAAHLIGHVGLTDLTTSLSGRPVTLAGQRWDRATPSPAGSGTTASDGTVALSVSPRVATTYVMSHAQDATYGRCDSGTALVRVRTKVTMSAALGAGRRIEVTGSTTPATRGTAVKLWRVRPGADTRLDSGTTTKKGTYALAAKATSTGAWKVYVKIAADTGNLAGTSPTATVQVR